MSAELLGKLKASEAVADLVTALSDTADGVVASSAVALGEIGDSAANERLVALLAHANPDVVKRAAEALGKIGSPSAVRALWPHRRDDPPRLRAEVIKALGMCHSYDSQASLSDSILHLSRELLDHWSPQIRIAAIVSLRSFEYTGSIRQLLRLANDPDEQIQHVAVQALGEIQSEDLPAWFGDPSPNQGLIISVLSDVVKETSNQAVRTKAIRSLGGIRADQATPLLELLVLEGTPEDRREARQALAMIRAPK
jgi:HEAT repeat protein